MQIGSYLWQVKRRTAISDMDKSTQTLSRTKTKLIPTQESNLLGLNWATPPQNSCICDQHIDVRISSCKFRSQIIFRVCTWRHLNSVSSLHPKKFFKTGKIPLRVMITIIIYHVKIQKSFLFLKGKILQQFETGFYTKVAKKPIIILSSPMDTCSIWILFLSLH